MTERGTQLGIFLLPAVLGQAPLGQRAEAGCPAPLLASGMTSAAQTRLEAALPAVLERLRVTPGAYAALWCGSAARGEANQHSDLDLHVLVQGDHRWRANWVVDGVPVEIFHNPPRKVRAMFAAGDAATIAMYAEGRAVWSHPDLEALVAEARARYATGPTPRPLTEQTRFALIDAVLDARALAEQADPLHAFMAQLCVRQLMPALFQARGWWEVKPQGWLAELEKREPEAAEVLRAVLTVPTAPERQLALEALTTRVTGDLTYRESASEPQRVE